jgi:hypothetical protein
MFPLLPNPKSLKRFAIASAFALSIGSASAMGETSHGSIAGSWIFETGAYNDGQCRLSGQMQIFATNQTNSYTCAFTTFETCTYLEGEIEQDCKILVEGDEVAFVSRITNIVRQEPQPYGYAPDDWLLKIISSDEMYGTLESASRAEVIFRRDGAPTS